MDLRQSGVETEETGFMRNREIATITIRLNDNEIDQIWAIRDVSGVSKADALRAALAAYRPSETDRQAIQLAASPLRGISVVRGTSTASFWTSADIVIELPANRRDVEGDWTYDTAPAWMIKLIHHAVHDAVTTEDKDHPAAFVAALVNHRFEYVVRSESDAGLIREHFEPSRPVIVG